MAGIPRKAAVITGIVAAPLVVLIVAFVPYPVAVVFAAAWAVGGVASTWWLWHRFSRRMKHLVAFANRMHEPDASLHRLTFSGDELGELTRALLRAAPRVAEIRGALNIERARREAILADVSEPVVAVDAKLQISFCNPQFVKIADVRGAAEGVPLIKVVRDPGLLQLLKRVLDTGTPIRQRLKMSGMAAHVFEVHATPIADSASSGALAILRDLSSAERLARTKRDFVANVSHEFRTPLATIAGYTETLLNGGLEDEQNRRRFVEIIQANSVRLNNIAADLLTLSELDAGQPATKPTAVAVDDVIQSAANAIAPVAKVHDVRLTTGPDSGLYVLGYRVRFEQALLNLMDNAVKFNRTGGEVKVAAVRRDHRIEISVSDTGIGIPDEDLSRVFERFYRVDKARSRQIGGTGLGLSIVRHAIEQMQGTVTVESKLGQGSCFRISLPFHGEVATSE